MAEDIWDFPRGQHIEIAEDGIAREHPGYRIVTCACLHSYPVGLDGYDPGWCGEINRHTDKRDKR